MAYADDRWHNRSIKHILGTTISIYHTQRDLYGLPPAACVAYQQKRCGALQERKQPVTTMTYEGVQHIDKI